MQDALEVLKRKKLPTVVFDLGLCQYHCSITNPATTMTPAFAAPSAAVSGKPLPVAEIVGGILVGIFAAVATITVGVIFLKRKKNRRRQKGNGFLFARNLLSSQLFS